MSSSIKIPLFCFLLVLNNIAMEGFVEFTFDAIPLAHSGLLVIWKPNITTQTEDEYRFEFETYIIEENDNENYKSGNDQNHHSVEKNNIASKSNVNKSDSSAGQYKIHSLQENKLYNVTIKQYSRKDNKTFLKEYFVEMRTNLKSQKIPAKPYFELETTANNLKSRKRVRWYPCGKERICNDQESGTHFGITIIEPYNTGKFSEVKREEILNDYIDILFWPGIYYEVVVYSVNGDRKTDSDCQEIFFRPTSTPVQHVSIISLPDSSALVSWKPPKHSLNKYWLHYHFHSFIFGEPHTDIQDRIWFYKDYNNSVVKIPKQIDGLYEQIRISNLKPEVTHTYVITPWNDKGVGFPYRIKQQFQVCDQDLPIAKPDFNYKFEKDVHDKCKFYFQWLPCGQSFNCENIKPGSNYTFHFEPEPPEKKDIQEYGYYNGTFDMGPAYYVTVSSSVGNNFSESVTKIFKDCKIRENTP